MKKAFTLVELLVVIAIIGLLSTLSVVALNSARAKARDARRLSDIKQLRTALDMYYDSAGTYPNSLTPGSPLSYGSIAFLTKVPDDPLSSQHYNYAQTENGQNYTIDFTLETKSAGYEPGNYRATPYAIIAGGGGGGGGDDEPFHCGDLLAYDGGPLDQDGNFVGDGGYYATQDLGSGDCWLMNNLNAGEMGDDKLCFQNELEVCSSEGGLYTQEQAFTRCPPGWSLPTVAQLEALINELNFTASGFWDSAQGFIPPAWLVTTEQKDDRSPIFYNKNNGYTVKNRHDAASVRCVLPQ